MSELPRCRHCGQVIGVYEPLITLRDGLPFETSRLMEPLVDAQDGSLYHRDCFEARHNGVQIPE